MQKQGCSTHDTLLNDGKNINETAIDMEEGSTFDPEKSLWLDLEFLNEQVDKPPTLSDDLINKNPFLLSHSEQIVIAELYISVANDPKSLLLNRWFDVKSYLTARTDVAQSNINASLHFFSCGYKEQMDVASFEPKPSDKVLRARAILDTSQQCYSPDTIYKEWTYAKQKPSRISSAIELANLIEQQLPATSDIVISLSHDNAFVNTGGIQKIIREESESCAEQGKAYIHISPTNPLPFPLESLSESAVSGATALVYINGQALGTILQSAISLLAKYIDTKERKTFFVLHHFFGFSLKSISSCISNFSRSKRAFWWIHDYSTSCISYTLLFNKTLGCGSPPPDSNQCDICEYGSIRNKYLRTLRDITKIKGLHFIFPSQAALETSKNGHSTIPSYATKTILPHGILSNLSIKNKMVSLSDRKIRISFIGPPVRHKGWDEFYALANDHRLSENFEFLQIGTNRATQNIKFVLGDGTKESCSVENALSGNHVDYAFIWPLWPETFCFVAYEAAAAGCHIFSNRGSGNIAKDFPPEITTIFEDIDSVLLFLLNQKRRGFASISYAEDSNFIGSNYSLQLINNREDNVQ
jgi:hypothetical protein